MRHVRSFDVFGRPFVAALAADEAAARDSDAIRLQGVPGPVLMENAGRAAAMVLDRLYPRGRVIAAVGSGSNGGDAMVLLRSLRAWGRDVACVHVGDRAPNPSLEHDFPIPRIPFEDFGASLGEAAVVVDGILGTGTRGAPRGAVAEAVEAINAAGRPCVALDLPSGIDPTTGEVPGPAVRAKLTVTCGWPKLGLLLHPGRAHCGRIVAVEIGLPPMRPDEPGAELITPAWAAARLRPRPANAWKGSVGRLLVVAGSEGMAGAAATAAGAALRAGAGYVRLAAPVAVRETLQTLVPGAVFVDREDEAAFDAALAASDALVVGPGLGRGSAARAALERALGGAGSRPVLLDADALWLLGAEPERLADLGARRPIVLTPHAGEMRRLTGMPVDDIVRRPIASARALAGRSGCIVLLKGAPSVIASPGAPALLTTVGSSDLAKAGMGDQLAGTIGAMLAALAKDGSPTRPGLEDGGLSLEGKNAGHPALAGARDAAGVGLFFAGRAADLAGQGRGLLPEEVSDALPAAFEDPGPPESALGFPFVTFDQPSRW